MRRGEQRTAGLRHHERHPETAVFGCEAHRQKPGLGVRGECTTRRRRQHHLALHDPRLVGVGLGGMGRKFAPREFRSRHQHLAHGRNLECARPQYFEKVEFELTQRNRHGGEYSGRWARIAACNT